MNSGHDAVFLKKLNFAWGKSHAVSLFLYCSREFIKQPKRRKYSIYYPLENIWNCILQTVSTLSAWLQCLISNALFHFMFLRSYSPFFKENDDQSSNYFSLVFQLSCRIRKQPVTWRKQVKCISTTFTSKATSFVLPSSFY